MHVKARKSLLEQTAVLTGSNLLVRMLGFIMRIWYSRVLGAEAMGVLELATSAHLLLITPVTSGLPVAMSRLVAQRRDARDDQGALVILAAGRRLVYRVCRVLFPLALVLSPWIARALGDERTLPALWAFLPCMLILGLSAVYNGYCYGQSNTFPPALSEIIEQALRFGVSALLLLSLHNVTLAWRAAFPAVATAIGEAVGVALVMWLIHRGQPRLRIGDDREVQRKLFRLALPMTLVRLSATGMRALSAVMIPLRLIASGLIPAEATARLGMFQGMAMPLMMLPSVFTGALAMIAAPALAERQQRPAALRSLFYRLLLAAIGISAAAMAVVYGGAELFARYLYHQPELTPLLRVLSPMVVVFGVQQVTGSMLAGLGLQRKGLIASLLGAAMTLLLTWVLTAAPHLRLFGCAYAMIAGQTLSVVLNLSMLFANVRERQAT